MIRPVTLLAILLLYTPAFAYTVILMDGTVVEGTVVIDNASLLQIVDALGNRRDIPKETIDPEKTARANQSLTGCNPPEPPMDMETVENELEALLPKTKDGKPILTTNGEVALALDFKRDDAVSRWGACLSRVEALMHTNKPGMLARCVDLIERCPDNTGGKACCPPACVIEFKKLMAAGKSEQQAVEESFLNGDCLTGFAQVMAPIRKSENESALEMAAVEGNLDEIKKLVKSGVNINAVCGDGFTPMNMAVMNRRSESVNILLALGADVNQKDSWGKTPLMEAAASNQIDILRILIHAHADLNAKSKDGQTALMLAVERGYVEIVRELKAAGATE